MGFCFFNNAGIAARYAQEHYGRRRVAVLDFDVHHGNGTEAGCVGNEALFYGSVHEEGGYPRTGPEPPVTSEEPMDQRTVNRYLPSGERSREVFVERWKELIQRMIHFAPEFIIISAGFDAHALDPMASCQLTESDYRWATAEVLSAARTLRPEDPIPCMSVLEGGYFVPALTRSIVEHCAALIEGGASPSVESSHR